MRRTDVHHENGEVSGVDDLVGGLLPLHRLRYDS